MSKLSGKKSIFREKFESIFLFFIKFCKIHHQKPKTHTKTKKNNRVEKTFTKKIWKLA